MKNIYIYLLILFFFGCANYRAIDAKLADILLPSSNMIELLKKLREYELISEDHIAYTKKKKINKEKVNDKIKDIGYVVSLTKRYDNWYLIWDERIELLGRELSSTELQLLKKAMKKVFNLHNKANDLASVLNHEIYQHQLDSVLFYRYDNHINSEGL
jgi:hypothetical protein